MNVIDAQPSAVVVSASHHLNVTVCSVETGESEGLVLVLLHMYK